MKNFSNTIGNRTRDLPACSAVLIKCKPVFMYVYLQTYQFGWEDDSLLSSLKHCGNIRVSSEDYDLLLNAQFGNVRIVTLLCNFLTNSMTYDLRMLWVGYKACISFTSTNCIRNVFLSTVILQFSEIPPTKCTNVSIHSFIFKTRFSPLWVIFREEPHQSVT